MPNWKRENLKVGFTKSDPPKGVKAPGFDRFALIGSFNNWNPRLIHFAALMEEWRITVFRPRGNAPVRVCG